MKKKKMLTILGLTGVGVVLGGYSNNIQFNNETNIVQASVVKKTKNKLGPVVGKIDGKPIRANQLLRDSNWNGGYGTPSDGKDTNKDNGPVRRITKNSKSIIIYWSRSGSTELLASKIAQRTDADIFEIQLQNPYPANYKKTLARANRERENNQPPKVVQDLPDLSQYDHIYLGYQTWAMTLSQPMQGFLRQYGNQFNNKTISPFETEGGYGKGDSVAVMKRLIRDEGGKNNRFTKTLVVDGNKVDKANKQVTKWIKQVNR